MKKFVILLIFSVSFLNAISQADSVFFFIKRGLISDIYLYFPNKTNYNLEVYTHFKGTYWIGKKDTVNLKDLTKTDSGLVDFRKKKPLFYKYYNTCDPSINKIRNGALYSDMHSNIYTLYRSKIGYDNEEFRFFSNSRIISKEKIDKLCYEEFKIQTFELKQKLTVFIDSVYNFKSERFLKLKSDFKTIDQAYVDAFIKTMNHSEPDFRSLYILMKYQSEMLLNSVSKLTDSEYFSFCLRLNDFPTDIDLRDARVSLLQFKNQYKRVKEILRKMRNVK